ncbi:oligosaccharide repeat unit polymerase [Maribacter litopenaei]|uniref:Oligosaccharide repeat unit polymerase n=1 Tax=Maribacter litopenaei TaxID=2976127 RepID=A0ABY5Y9T4_9FLAO|nr:O-antigen polymerase [Maribacter litopenaei]UWX55004.1 oligosaccharide repeat unit polymerase [Maribacter litopenaei]
MLFIQYSGIILQSFEISLFLSLVSFALLVLYTIDIVGVNSVLFLFVILFGLYGYSVPVSVFFNADIGWHRVAKLKTWQLVDDTLFSFMLSNQLALLAILIAYIIFVRRRTMRIPFNGNNGVRFGYFHFSIIAGILSSCSEGINFLRVGGFSAIRNGKAFYQGAVNDLILNIPYEGFFFISVALFAIFFTSLKTPNGKYLIYLPLYMASISFVLLVNLMIGERGLLVVALFIFFPGYTVGYRITKVKKRYILLLGILYVGFSFLTLLREDRIKYEGFFKFVDTYQNLIVRIMNPANTEFGSPALNYRIFMDKKETGYKYKLGKTYLEISYAFIPTYIYPGKPIGIVYEFRNKYFPERRQQGSTAGTGFSSLMEAYMNFGYIGPLLVYFISIFFLIYLESKKGGGNMFINLLYLLSFNLFLIFSRSSSQYILQNAVFYLVEIVVVVLIYKALPKKLFSKLEALNEKA